MSTQSPAADPPQRLESDRFERAPKVSERLARRIATDVVDRKLQPGARLASESSMLENYGVSRPSLREGLRILEVYGLIRMKPGPGGGPFVTEVDSREFADSSSFYFFLRGATLRNAIETKSVIEPQLARLAAERVGEEGLARLAAILHLEREEMAADSRDWGNAPAEFHRLIAELAANPVLELFSNSILELQRASSTEAEPADRAATVRFHERMYEAMQAHDGAEAERLMRRHTEEQLHRLSELIPERLDERIEW